MVARHSEGHTLLSWIIFVLRDWITVIIYSHEVRNRAKAKEQGSHPSIGREDVTCQGV